MAQKLKEETRIKILEAAREEFREKGYQNATMRSIAAKSGITAGNIYRYFKNKEELNSFLLSETANEMRLLLDSLRINRISLQPRVFEMKSDPLELRDMMDQLAFRLYELYLENDAGFSIFLHDEKNSAVLLDWFEKTFRDLILRSYSFSERRKLGVDLSHAFSVSILQGLKEIFSSSDKQDPDLLILLRVYLHSYIKMAQEEIILRKYY